MDAFIQALDQPFRRPAYCKPTCRYCSWTAAVRCCPRVFYHPTQL